MTLFKSFDSNLISKGTTIQEYLMGLPLGGGGVVIPVDTGPGPTELIGYHLTDNNTKISGFFGETTTNQLITGSALAALIGLTTGTVQNDADPWLRFILDGQILFVAKRSLRRAISWNNIAAVNAVYGDRIVEIQDYSFKVRLLQGINPGEPVPNTIDYDPPITHRSEWNRLLYPIVADNATYPKTSQVGPNWVTYTEAEIGLGPSGGTGRASWCQETPYNSTTFRAIRGYFSTSLMDWVSSSRTDYGYGWRPVLELIN